MRYWVHHIFEEGPPFLKKIQDFHNETGLPIWVSLRPWKRPEHSDWLWRAGDRLLPQHRDLVRQYLPATTVQIARDTYTRSQYHKYKLHVAFVENAIAQIQDYDPFFLTMDDIHDSDMLLTDLISKKLFYQEKIMSVRK